MRNFIIAWLSIVYIVLSACPVSASDYEEKYDLVIDSGIISEFDSLAVKSDRPMPWRVFADNTYKTLKGDGGKRADSDWFRDKEATVWLIILDEDFRRNAKLIYLDEKTTGDKDFVGWYSLDEMEKSVYPVLMEKAMGGHDDEAMKIIEGVIGRGAIVNNLQLELLLLVPDPEGDPVGNRRLTPANLSPATLKRYWRRMKREIRKRSKKRRNLWRPIRVAR